MEDPGNSAKHNQITFRRFGAAIRRGTMATYTNNEVQTECSLDTVGFSILLKMSYDVDPIPHRLAWTGLVCNNDHGSLITR